MSQIVTPPITPTIHIKNGSPLSPKTVIATLTGNAHSILKTERVMLNLLQRLSGIATQTNAYVHALNNPNIQILDTRKTTPLWRDLERKAVLAGGGYNHRHNLSDMVLIKENHLALNHTTPEQLATKLRTIKQTHPHLKIEIEIETLAQLETLPLEDVDYILLDNFSETLLDKAIMCCQKKYPTKLIEVSGNITLANIHTLQTKAIHRISCGALTHSVTACDLSLLIQ